MDPQCSYDFVEEAHPPALVNAQKLYDPKLIDMVTRSIRARTDANAKIKLGWSEDDTMWVLHGIEIGMSFF
jgi:hypothetical protein